MNKLKGGPMGPMSPMPNEMCAKDTQSAEETLLQRLRRRKYELTLKIGSLDRAIGLLESDSTLESSLHIIREAGY